MKIAHTLLAIVFLSAPALAQPPDDTTLVVFTRHTFRGVNRTVGPQKVALADYGIECTLPALSYGYEASQHGLVFAQHFGAPGINQAASKAVEGLGGSRFNGHWDEIRADLSASRCFFTALYIREGLQPLQKAPILLTGCPTEEGKGVDPVSIGYPVSNCIPPDELRQIQAASPNLERLREAGESLLSLVGAALGHSGPYHLPPPVDPVTGAPNPVYTQVGNLASAIEMTSELGPPLHLIFPQASGVQPYEKDAVRRASNFLGVRFSTVTPLELAHAWAVFPVQFIQQTAPGRHVIVLSHDSDISAMLRSLGLMSENGKVDDMAVYPIESIVFAMNQQRVCVARMQVHKKPDGSLGGPYDNHLIWQGTRAEWDLKVQTLIQEAENFKPGAVGRANIHILPAEPLNVLPETTNFH